MGLDAADQQCVIGRDRVFALIECRAVGDLPDLAHCHGGTDFCANARLRHAELSEHVDLTFGCGSTVAAHHWHNIGVYAGGAQGVDRSLYNDWQVGDAATTRTDSHRRSWLHAGEDTAGLKRILHCRWDMGDFGSIETLVNLQ